MTCFVRPYRLVLETHVVVADTDLVLARGLAIMRIPGVIPRQETSLLQLLDMGRQHA